MLGQLSHGRDSVPNPCAHAGQRWGVALSMFLDDLFWPRQNTNRRARLRDIRRIGAGLRLVLSLSTRWVVNFHESVRVLRPHFHHPSV